MNHAVHHIDMINWMKGELPQKVTSILSNVMHDNAEVEEPLPSPPCSTPTALWPR